MSPLFWVTYVALWILVAMLTALVLLLYRQHGQSVLPAKARMQLAGLDIGSRIPDFEVVTEDSELVGLPVEAGDRGPFALQLFLFTAPGCSICGVLQPQVGDLVDRYPNVSFWWLSNGRVPHEADADPGPTGWSAAYARELGKHPEQLEIPVIPFAYAVDSAGVIRGKGLMNEVADFDQLITVSVENGAHRASLEIVDAHATGPEATHS